MRKILRKIKNKLFSPPIKQDYIRVNDARVQSILKILDDGYGHKISYELQKPVDVLGNPLPWFTYPAIEFLKQLNLIGLSVFEWGMGNSTLYFAPKVKHVLSIEHNKEWFDLISKNLPKNVTAILESAADYDKYPLKENRKFDLIIVDGIKRKECLNIAPKLLTENGLIIFDNSDRNPELCENLRNENFLETDFHGFGPINPYTWTTSIFFKRNNTFKPGTFQPLIPIGGGF